MSVCLSVCVSVCLCVCVSVCLCACLSVCMYVSIYLCIYVSMYLCMYACMHVCMYACMHVCMYACMHVCMYACMYACMHVCMYVIILCKICKYVFICWDWLAQLLGQASHSWEKMDGFGTWSKASWTCWLSRLCDTEVKLDHHGEEAPSLVCQKQHLQSELL